jgi:hypothetical protein
VQNADIAGEANEFACGHWDENLGILALHFFICFQQSLPNQFLITHSIDNANTANINIGYRIDMIGDGSMHYIIHQLSFLIK